MLIYSYPKLLKSNKSKNVYKIKKNNKEDIYIYIYIIFSLKNKKENKK